MLQLEAVPLSTIQLPETFFIIHILSGNHFGSGGGLPYVTSTDSPGPLLCLFPSAEGGPIIFLQVAFKTGVIWAVFLSLHEDTRLRDEGWKREA